MQPEKAWWAKTKTGFKQETSGCHIHGILPAAVCMLLSSLISVDGEAREGTLWVPEKASVSAYIPVGAMSCPLA